MIKKLLFLFLCLSTCIGSWGQFYKFTEAAQGNLYTAKNISSLASTPKGEECKTSYYVKSDYALLEAPLPFTTTQSKSFKVKTYYVENAGNYTNAYEQIYDAVGTTYYTASETQLNFSDDDIKNTYLESSEKTVFTNYSDVVNGYVYIKVGDDYVEQVKEGDVFDPTKTYALHNRPYQPDYTLTSGDFSGWAASYITSKNVFAFKNTVIGVVYINDNGVFTLITDNTYTEGKEYFTVVFNAIDDAVKADMASNPENYFDVKETISDITVDYNVYTYNSVTGAYTKVNVGDTFFPGGEYYKDAEDFVLRTPAELVVLGFVKTVGVMTQPSEDGKTLTILCSGDVCEPDDEFSTEGYKFAQKAINTIYPGKVENSVKENDIYNENQEYYTRAQKYTEQEIPTTTKYQLLQSAYVNNSGRYDVVNAGTDINNGAYYTLANEGEEFNHDEISTTSAYKFNDAANGWIYVDYGYNNIQPISVNGELNSETNYVKANDYNNPWNGNYTSISYDNLKDGETYVSIVKTINADPVLYTIEGTSYVPAAGTVYDKAKTYYSGVSFTTIDNIKENTAYATPVISVNPGATEYFVLNGETYTKVNAGETYDADKTYYIKDGFDYNVIAKATLISDLYMTSATVAENYWDALVNDINAAGYETVVFTTKEGDAEHATICEHVTRAMMKTTTVNALDYQSVQIASLEPLSIKDQNGEWQDNPKSTFWASSANTSVTVLLLPEIKNAKDVNGVEHRHVPQVCNNFWSLNLIVMPNNATCIEEGAFIRNSFNGGITEYELKTIVFNNTLKRIGKDAFNGHIGLNNLTFPASMEYIGKNAFDGGIKDVYFLGENAPIVEKDAFSDKAYLCNNAIKDNYIINDWYRVDRNAYVNGDYMAAMLHVPTGIAANKLAAYTDPTRHYHVFEWLPYEIEAKNVSSEEEAMLQYPQASSAETRNGKIYVKFDAIHSNDITKEVDGSNGQTRAMVYYCSGDAADAAINPSWGSAASGSNAYLDGGRVWGTDDWINGYNHNKSSGLYDLYAGTNYIWPCQANMNRGFAVASHGLLWNGKSTIADGINGTSAGVTGTVTATYDSDCDGTDDKSYTDGKEYMGLHEFILVSADVAPGTDTQEWDFNTIAGANWYTICVPVDMTVEEVRNTFGERTQVCKFNSISRDSNDKIKFGFTDEQCYGKTDLTAKAIVANQAYMIRPSKYDGADNKFTLPHYTIADQVIPQPTTLECQDVHDGNDNKTYTYTFIGNYNTQPDGTPIYMQKYTYYLGADSKNSQLHKLFIQTGETGKWKPYSCVIIPSDGEADYNTFFAPKSSKSTTCYFGLDAYEEEGNSVTQITEYKVVCGSENAPIYNLNGQFVGDNMSKLPQGIYVKNGKKFIVK